VCGWEAGEKVGFEIPEDTHTWTDVVTHSAPRPTTEASVTFSPLGFASMAGLFVAAALTRFTALAPGELWFDDAWTGLAARSPDPVSAMLTGLTSPGFTFLQWFVAWPFGVSPLASQLLPFLMGIIVPPVGYMVARVFGLSRWAALLTGGLLLASPVLVTYSTRVKPFTSEAVMALVILWAGVRVIRDPASRARWALLVGVAVSAVVFSGTLALVGAAAVAAGVLIVT
jgi:hypothetical protein